LSFNYITFAEIWTGLFHVLAVDYDRYMIFSLHPYYRDEGRSMPCEWWKHIRKWNLSGFFANITKVIISFVMAVGPSVSQ